MVSIPSEEDIRRIIREEVRAALGEVRPAGEILSTEDAAKLARRSVARVRAWIDAGELAATKRGRVWVIRRRDLERYLAGEKGPPVAELAASIRQGS